MCIQHYRQTENLQVNKYTVTTTLLYKVWLFILQQLEGLVAGSQRLFCYAIKFTSIHFNMKSVLCHWINALLPLSELNIYKQFFTRN